MIKELLTLYKKQFPFDKFYDTLLYNISTYPDYHIASKTFLKGYSLQSKSKDEIPRIYTSSGDIRVDLPVWFGDPNAAYKIVVVGMEPRDTDKDGYLNIERVDRFVFATPFALERPRGPYYSAFHDLTHAENAFVYFTDVVKTYQVTGDKAHDDLTARQTFLQQAEDQKGFLLEELNLIKPNKIVALGNESFTFLKEYLGDTYQLQRVRHPSQGGALIARKQLGDILQQQD